MRLFRLMLFPVLFVAVAVHMYAAPFSLFPKASHLASPDGRFEVRDVDLREPGSEFSGIFHSLWLVETATGDRASSGNMWALRPWHGRRRTLSWSRST